MKTPGKAQDRLEAVARIEEYERNGWWDKDIEINDPPAVTLMPKDVDYLNKKLSSKIKTAIANIGGRLYFNRAIRKKQYIFKGVVGEENLNGLSEGAMVTCNHFNRFDNYAVYIGLKRYIKGLTLYKIVREGNYAFTGLIGFFMKNCNTLPLSSNFSTMKNCINAVSTLLSRGKLVLIYPEQGMWWNYRKPRPLKLGAFRFATKNMAPVVPTFITLKDSGITGGDGFPVQEYTLNILPVIRPDSNLSVQENCRNMLALNERYWKETYERVYGIPLEYLR